MGPSLDEVLARVSDGQAVSVTVASNQNNGVVGYAVGTLTYQSGSGNILKPGEPFRPARFDGKGLKLFFSNRMVPGAPGEGQFANPRQPFDVDATESIDVSISLGFNVMHPTMELSFFGGSNRLSLSRMGELWVGLGPSLWDSPPAVFAVSFAGIVGDF